MITPLICFVRGKNTSGIYLGSEVAKDILPRAVENTGNETGSGLFVHAQILQAVSVELSNAAVAVSEGCQEFLQISKINWVHIYEVKFSVGSLEGDGNLQHCCSHG